MSLLTIATSCATNRPRLPDCAPPEEMLPLPDDRCRFDPAVQEYALRFFDSIHEDVGTLIVRVQFTPSSNIGGICADRSSLKQTWMYRADVGERLAELPELESAPACLANRRLDFNETAAMFASVEELTKECGREASRRLEADRQLGVSAPYDAELRASDGLRFCLEQHQRRRGEIWFSDEYGTVHSIFSRTENSSERRSAVSECSDIRPKVNPSGFGRGVGLARPGAALRACMAAHGWRAGD